MAPRIGVSGAISSRTTARSGVQTQASFDKPDTSWYPVVLVDAAEHDQPAVGPHGGLVDVNCGFG